MALETSSSSLGQFDIANLPMRVVTPPRPRPLINLNDDKTVDIIREIFGEELESTAVKIEHNHVKAKKIYAVLRSRALKQPKDRLCFGFIRVPRD